MMPTTPSTSSSSSSSSSSSTERDPFQSLLQHQDFAALVALAAKVKRMRSLYHCYATAEQQTQSTPASSKSNSSSSSSNNSGSAFQTNEVLQAVTSLQSTLLTQEQQSLSTLMRGMDPLTDMLMDDILQTLQREVKAMESLQNVLAEESKSGSGKTSKASTSNITTSSSSSSARAPNTPPPPPPPSSSSSSVSTPIATKYSKQQTDILMNWMIANVHQPFPSTQDIQELMEQTQLSQSQVINWTTNVRKRNRKATCEQGKKPHHFLDFLFLKQQKQQQQQSESSLRRKATKQSFHKSDYYSFASDTTPSRVYMPPSIATAAIMPYKDMTQNTRVYMPPSVVKKMKEEQEQSVVAGSKRRSSCSHRSSCAYPFTSPQQQYSPSPKETMADNKDDAYPSGDNDDELWSPLDFDNDEELDQELLSEFADFWMQENDGQQQQQQQQSSALSYQEDAILQTNVNIDNKQKAMLLSSNNHNQKELVEKKHMTPPKHPIQQSSFPSTPYPHATHPNNFSNAGSSSILPSITIDSYDDAMMSSAPPPSRDSAQQQGQPPPSTRYLSNSLELNMEDVDEDIVSWAVTMGLAMESV